MRNLVLGLSALILVGGPSTAQAQTSAEGSWQVGRGAHAARLTISGPLISGTTGCRNFRAEVTGSLERASIRVLPLAGTCRGASRTTDERFIRQLHATRSFSLNAGQLEARDPRGALLFTATRAEPRTTLGPHSALNGRWSLQRLAEPMPPNARRSIRIQDGQIAVSGACNTASGTIVIEPGNSATGTLQIIVSSQTTNLCADGNAEIGDGIWFEVLQRATSYRRTGQNLEMFDTDQRLLITLIFS